MKEVKEGFLVKGWRAFAILLLFVAMPAASWYYLSSGLDWRKAAVSELKNFGKIRESWLVNPDGSKINLLENKVCVLHCFGENPDLTAPNKKILDTGEELFKQFGLVKNETLIREEFRIVAIADGATPAFRDYCKQLPSGHEATWVFSGGLGGWRTILENGYDQYCHDEKITPATNYWAVSDTTGVIRRFYDAEDATQMERMVQHVAILLPK